MLSDNEEGLGDLFSTGGANNNTNEELEYPIEEMIVDRVQLLHEGKTNVGFTPLLKHFDRAVPDEERTTMDLMSLKVYFRNKRHSLWGHKLWNAAKYIVKRIDSRMIDVRGKTVLELGAGLGVPSLAAFRNGARCVVVTDYPDAELLDILERNVRENCTTDMLDPDAVAFLLQEAQQLKTAWGQTDEDHPTVLTEAEIQRATNTRCVVEPLLWGKESHIHQVLSYTGGSGFDIVLLSDILFNHICNDDLADTLVHVLQQSRRAAAYCVFSHHRAHKQVEDLEFFDKCVARGLRYVQLDEEDYPLMFPDDQGPAEIRQPVKVYKIVHRFDDAGTAFKPGDDIFDVVIQGTGMVESFLSAACARSGMRVLQCDGADDYSGPFRTMTVEQMREFLRATAETSDLDGNYMDDNNHMDVETIYKSDIVVDRMDELDPCERRHFLLDLLPNHYLKNGETVQQLESSEMARHLDFHCFCGFAFLFPLTGFGFQLQNIPLTRAQVFATNQLSLLQKRRIMKFVKDVEASLAEQLHAHTANVGDDPYLDTALEQTRMMVEKTRRLFEQEANVHPNETFSAMIERKYGISDVALDTVTLLQQLDMYPTDMVRSVELVRQVLTSIGIFNNLTPFMHSLYGASEVSQNMCRIAAVWNATLVMRRSIVPKCAWRQSVIEGNNMPLVEMSNRQRVKAKVVVVPRTLANKFMTTSSVTVERAATEKGTINVDATNMNKEVRFSRVIMVARSPLFSWAALRAAGCVEGNKEEEEEGDNTESFPPLVLALCRVRPGVVVHIQQVSSSTQQAPHDGNSVVVHFTANEWEMKAGELQQLVLQSFVRRDDLTNSNSSLTVDESQLLFLASFVLREKQEALRSIIHKTEDDDDTSILTETHKAHPYAMEEYQRRLQKQKQQKQLCHGETDGDDESFFLLPVPTLFQNLIDDSAYIQAAEQAYYEVVRKLQLQNDNNTNDKKKYMFLERLPPIS